MTFGVSQAGKNTIQKKYFDNEQRSLLLTHVSSSKDCLAP
jgi:hypothetical protein